MKLKCLVYLISDVINNLEFHSTINWASKFHLLSCLSSSSHDANLRYNVHRDTLTNCTLVIFTLNQRTRLSPLRPVLLMGPVNKAAFTRVAGRRCGLARDTAGPERSRHPGGREGLRRTLCVESQLGLHRSAPVRHHERQGEAPAWGGDNGDGSSHGGLSQCLPHLPNGQWHGSLNTRVLASLSGALVSYFITAAQKCSVHHWQNWLTTPILPELTCSQ